MRFYYILLYVKNAGKSNSKTQKFNKTKQPEINQKYCRLMWNCTFLSPHKILFTAGSNTFFKRGKRDPGMSKELEACMIFIEQLNTTYAE